MDESGAKNGSAAGEESPAIVLYGPAGVPFTEKVRRALMLKKLAFELREPQSPEDYRRWNPETGMLPVLEVGGTRIPDSTEILLRLDALFPEPPLLSAEPRTANQQQQLEDWADESFLWYFLRWRRMAEEREQRRAGVNGGRGGAVRRLRALGAWLKAGGTWERPQVSLLRQVADRMDDLLNLLGGRPFFYAERVSMADLAVYAMLRTLSSDAIPGAARMLAERPALLDYMRRVESATGD